MIDRQDCQQGWGSGGKAFHSLLHLSYSSVEPFTWCVFWLDMTHLLKYVSYLWQSYHIFKVHSSFSQFSVVAFCLIESIILSLSSFFVNDFVNALEIVLGCSNLTYSRFEVLRILKTFHVTRIKDLGPCSKH